MSHEQLVPNTFSDVDFFPQINPSETVKPQENFFIGPDVSVAEERIIPVGQTVPVPFIITSDSVPKNATIERLRELKEQVRSRAAQLGFEMEDTGNQIADWIAKKGRKSMMKIELAVSNIASCPIGVATMDQLFQLYSLDDGYIFGGDNIRELIKRGMVSFHNDTDSPIIMADDGSGVFLQTSEKRSVPMSNNGPIMLPNNGNNSHIFRHEKIGYHLVDLPPADYDGEVFTIGETKATVSLEQNLYAEIDRTVYRKDGNLFIPAGKHTNARLCKPGYQWPIRVETRSTYQDLENQWIKFRFAHPEGEAILRK